ncbi:MAG: TusE/DsrC/DsvC family sulfur relay protein [Chromatiaceae bacterium]|nr:MAG: TusE/DsrC/DsvC family sulfur relay protein [Chromatiaceae bacterium]
MTAMHIAGREVHFNKHGLLASFNDWDNDVAEALAAEQGLALNDCHWAVIHFLREYYAFHEIPPSPKVIIRAIGHQVSPHLPCTRKNLQSLFPMGGCKQACRLAGLPEFYCHSC